MGSFIKEISLFLEVKFCIKCLFVGNVFLFLGFFKPLFFQDQKRGGSHGVLSVEVLRRRLVNWQFIATFPAGWSPGKGGVGLVRESLPKKAETFRFSPLSCFSFPFAYLEESY